MKYIFRNIDTSVIFYESQLNEAIEYFRYDLGETADEINSIDELADVWNSLHSGDAIGEMVVKEI